MGRRPNYLLGTLPGRQKERTVRWFNPLTGKWVNEDETAAGKLNVLETNGDDKPADGHVMRGLKRFIDGTEDA